MMTRCITLYTKEAMRDAQLLIAACIGIYHPIVGVLSVSGTTLSHCHGLLPEAYFVM